MRALAAAIALSAAACSPPPQRPVIENRARRDPRVCTHVTGIVIDGALAEPAIGATVVFDLGGVGEDVVLTDEKGTFVIDLTHPRERLTIYYDNRMYRFPFDPCAPLRVTLPNRR